MNSAICPKCRCGIFQIQMISPIASNNEYLALVCHQCGTVISLVPGDSHNSGSIDIEKKIEKLQNSVDQLNSNIGKIAVGLRNLVTKFEKPI